MAESSGFIAHRSLVSNGRRKPVHAKLSNHWNKSFERKLLPSSGQGFWKIHLYRKIMFEYNIILFFYFEHYFFKVREAIRYNFGEKQIA